MIIHLNAEQRTAHGEPSHFVDITLRTHGPVMGRQKLELVSEPVGLSFVIDAEDLLRSVKAAWEMIKPMEKGQ